MEVIVEHLRLHRVCYSFRRLGRVGQQGRVNGQEGKQDKEKVGYAQWFQGSFPIRDLFPSGKAQLKF